MNLKALSLGAVLGLLVAVVPSCGTQACGPQNCAGCCDSANKCVPASASNSNTACGTKGATCVNCATTAQTCNAGTFTCQGGTGTGGGTATGGGTGGGTATGGGTGGGTTGGGTGGGTTGGGTGGGTTGGGTGGGSTGGGGGTAGCNVQAQTGCNAGESCMYRPDQSTGCFAGVCDVVSQNCPTGTDKCSYAGLADGGVARACAPAGVKTEGQACGPSTDDCAKGLLCVNGTCAKFCYASTNCTGSGQCIGGVTIGGATEVPTTCVTLASCDPLLQNCTNAAQGCYLTSTGPACITAGSVAIGASCTMGNCVKGAICLGTPQAASCHQYCNLDGGTPSCTGTTCGGVTNQAGMQQPWGACQ